MPEIFGPRVFYTLLALFCAWATYSAARGLRVNRSPHTYGALLANATFLTILILIGFFHTPFFLTFPPALIVLTVRPTAATAFSIAPQTCARCSKSVPDPICMCTPVTDIP